LPNLIYSKNNISDFLPPTSDFIPKFPYFCINERKRDQMSALRGMDYVAGQC